MTKFSVVFIHKILYNAEKKQRENEGEKNILKTNEKRESRTIKFKKHS